MIEYFMIITTTALFGGLHSGMSATRVKNRFIDRYGREGYSRLFNITSILSFLLAFLSVGYWDWLYFIVDSASVNLLLFALGIGLLVAGMYVAISASRVISVSAVADMRTDREAELVTSGLYARVRHPLYLATVLVFLALPVLYPAITIGVFSLSMIVYTLIGARLEERKLVSQYGDAYRNYRKTAGFILPCL
ncbi:MAG: methyltransferase family protein [Candidatus Thorarchaeota archaeon]